MAAAANYAFANRQILARHVRRSFEEALRGHVRDVGPASGVRHRPQHGQDRAPPGRPASPSGCASTARAPRAPLGRATTACHPAYRPIGQPVLVPGSMGTASWVLLGTEGSHGAFLRFTCHGAGRRMSRHQAKRSVRGDRLRTQLEQAGIAVRAGSLPGLAEEAPSAYKDVDAVVEVVTRVGIATKVARLRPVAVVKG